MAIPKTATPQLQTDTEGERAAQDGTTAGAEGDPQNPTTAPGSNRSIPEPYRSAIVPDAGVHVP